MSFRSRTTLVLPLVLLVVALLETIVTFKVHEHVHDVLLRTAIIVALVGIGFTIATGWVAPGLAKLLHRLRAESASVGVLGIWVFYAMCYGLVFYLYYVVEKYGAAELLPKSLR